MVDITHKRSSLRNAIAEAIVVVSKQETIDALVNNKVPKGNVFEMAKTAGLFGVKRTSDMIPDCHPLPIEYTKVAYEIDGLNVIIKMEVSCIYRTGVEVEAMHGASVVALTMYDMLKPIDKGIEIRNIRLLHKTGGKSDYKNKIPTEVNIGLIITSNAMVEKKKENKLTPLISNFFDQYNISIAEQIIIPDEKHPLLQALDHMSGQKLVIIAGGTGLTVHDKTPEVIRPLLDRPIPGIGEAIRKYGDDRTIKSLMSRSFGGMKDGQLILALPGSRAGLKDALHALFPFLLTIVNKLK